MTTYFPENIINWKTSKIDGRNKLSLVVLKEIMGKGGDEFKKEEQTIYRLLRLVSGPIQMVDGELLEGLIFVVERWIKVEKPQKPDEFEKPQKPDEFVLIDSVIPRLQGGNHLDYIPFTFIGTTTTNPKVEKSQLLDLVNVNLSHYRTSADLEHGRHFTALPTAWVAGFDVDKGNKLQVGSATAWVSDNPNARAGFLEFSGAGLGSLEKAQDSKERLMAVLGARLLEAQRQGVEAAEALQLRQSGEGSVLLNVALSVSEGVTFALKAIADWFGIQEKSGIIFKLNTDFNVVKVDSAILTTLMQSLQGGNISWDTWFYNLERGELIPDGVDADTERGLIEQGVPAPTPEKGAGDKEFGKQEDKKEDEEDDEEEE